VGGRGQGEKPCGLETNKKMGGWCVLPVLWNEQGFECGDEVSDERVDLGLRGACSDPIWRVA